MEPHQKKMKMILQFRVPGKPSVPFYNASGLLVLGVKLMEITATCFPSRHLSRYQLFTIGKSQCQVAFRHAVHASWQLGDTKPRRSLEAHRSSVPKDPSERELPKCRWIMHPSKKNMTHNSLEVWKIHFPFSKLDKFVGFIQGVWQKMYFFETQKHLQEIQINLVCSQVATCVNSNRTFTTKKWGKKKNITPKTKANQISIQAISPGKMVGAPVRWRALRLFNPPLFGAVFERCIWAIWDWYKVYMGLIIKGPPIPIFSLWVSELRNFIREKLFIWKLWNLVEVVFTPPPPRAPGFFSHKNEGFS